MLYSILTNDNEPTQSAGNENMKVLRRIKAFQFLFTGLLLAFLSACGGGGGTSDPGFIGGGINNPGGGDDPAAGGTMTIALTDTDGNPTNTISNASPGIVTVTVLDITGAPAANELVDVSVTVGGISPSSALTTAEGLASFVLEAANQSGAGTVTATVSALDLTASVNFQIDSVTSGNNVLTLNLTDSAGNPVTNITSISPGTLTVTATDAFGQPVADEILSAVATLGTLSPESGTALTDLNGVGTFTISSGGVLGAGSATVTLGTVSSSVNYQIGEANLRVGRIQGSTFIEGEIEAGATTLPAAGSTTLSVAVVDPTDTPVTSTVPVQFGSGCAAIGLADISENVNTVNGIATSTYTANGCTGTDTVTASIVGGNTQSASVVLTIATADVNSIAFVSAEPPSIALKGTGGQGRSESSQVSFQVIDNTGAPASGVDVSFSLSTTIGGLSLTNATATTNENGIATAIVLAGNVSTSVRVTATIDVNGQLLSTVSDQLVVSTGLPDQNSVSLSASILNPGGGNLDGITTSINVRMADKFNNPVPDGTVAFFTSEFGAVVDSCQLQGGVCSVTWTSQEPRLPLIYNSTEDVPPDEAFVSTIANRDCPETLSTGRPCASSLGPIFGRRSQVSVIAVGEESFIDTNGNGLYDVGEPFDDLPEAFLDKNENGVFDNTAPLCAIDSTTTVGRECAEGQEEIFFDFDEDGVYDQANGLYNGSLCPEALANAGQCSRDLLHVRQDLTVVMSGVQTLAMLENGVSPAPATIVMSSGGGNRSFVVLAADFFNNLPSAGTAVTVSADGCQILGGESTVPNTSARGAFGVGFTIINQPDNTATINGSIEVLLSGSVGTQDISLIFGCVDDPG